MPFEEPELYYAGRGRYKVTNEPAFKGKTQTFVIEKGYTTDLATSPRIFWALIPPHGTYEAATVLHDWLCTKLFEYHQAMHSYLERFDAGIHAEKPPPPPVSSVDADGLFRRVMREGGVGFVTRWVMWAAVRWGALFNAARRRNWLAWPETPLVLLITAIELVVVVALAVAIHLTVDWIGELFT